MTNMLMVRGTKWKIKFVKRMPPGEDDACGLCDTEAHIIYIKKGMKPDVTMETFLHEYMHALMFEIGLHEEFSKEIEHTIVVALSRDMKNSKTFWKNFFKAFY
jgi:hypothetical protein